jgi:hypothetical protein
VDSQRFNRIIIIEYQPLQFKHRSYDHSEKEKKRNQRKRIRPEKKKKNFTGSFSNNIATLTGRNEEDYEVFRRISLKSPIKHM